MIFKKILLDILLIALLFIPTLFISGAVQILTPGCYTCGVTMGITFWFTAVIALQPVFWVAELTKSRRFIIWLIAVLLGLLSYLGLELIGTQMFLSGNSSGLLFGFFANTSSEIVALLVSIIGVQKTLHKLRNKTSPQ